MKDETRRLIDAVDSVYKAHLVIKEKVSGPAYIGFYVNKLCL